MARLTAGKQASDVSPDIRRCDCFRTSQLNGCTPARDPHRPYESLDSVPRS
jgi:hypothetical protein